MKIAVIQNDWRGSPEETLNGALEFVTSCSVKKPDIVLLGESFLGRNQEACSKIADRAIDLLKDKAKTLGIWIVAGTVPKNGMMNCSCIDSEGKIVEQFSQTMRDKDIKASTKIPVIAAPFGKFGVLIGIDLWVIEHPRIQSLQGAETILVPGLTDGQPGVEQVGTIWGIAALTCVNVVYASTRTKSGALGYSCFVTPTGVRSVLKESGVWSVVEFHDSEIRKLREPDLTFKNTLWYALWGRRPKLYAELTKRKELNNDSLKMLL
jgi:predicted amidohydrolase